MAYDKVVDSAQLNAGLTAVADKLREKTGSTEELSFPDGFVSTAGEVFDAGAKSEYDRFWDSAQQNGEKRIYVCSFSGYSWQDENYNPKYPIIATENSNYLFWNCVSITSTKVPIHLSTTGLNNSNTFNTCYNLVTIPLLVVAETTVFVSSFTGCTKLKNLTIEGVIGNNMTLSPCTALSHDSLMSVINHLKDYVAEGLGTTKTMTLGATNLAKLTAEEKQIATDKGWTLV